MRIIQVRIDRGLDIKSRPLPSAAAIEELFPEKLNWSRFNKELLLRLFDSDYFAREYFFQEDVPWTAMPFDGATYIFNKELDYEINILKSVLDRLELIPEPIFDITPVTLDAPDDSPASLQEASQSELLRQLIADLEGIQQQEINEKAFKFNNWLESVRLSVAEQLGEAIAGRFMKHKIRAENVSKIYIVDQTRNVLAVRAIEDCRGFLEGLIEEIRSHSFMTEGTRKPADLTAHDSRNVFVVHGRNLEARDALFRFLRSVGLRPLEWSQAIKETGKASPFIGEILNAAFTKAQAVVVLMTPDDEAQLQEQFRSPHDPPYESKLTGQARPNVLFEAGMAMGRNPDRTILVELGTVRPFSDIAGRHTVRLSNDTAARQALAQRLETAGCAVELSGTDWHREGDFNLPSTSAAVGPPPPAASAERTSTTSESTTQLSNHDRKLASLFLSEFPSHGKLTRFLRDHDFGGSFRSAEVERIDDFVGTWDDAEHEFHNPELESKRRALREVLITFSRELTHSASSTRDDILAIRQPNERFTKELEGVRERLNDLGTEAYEAHQDLVRAITRHS